MSSKDPKTSPPPHEKCTCKIGKGIEKYGIRELHNHIIQKYEVDDTTLRELETIINREFAAAALKNPDRQHRDSTPIETTPEEIVQVLHVNTSSSSTDDSLDEPGRGDAMRVETQLKQAGIDVETLQKSFVSYRTVKNHLNDCVDVDTSRNETITIDSARKTTGWARSRCEAVITKTITRLENAGLVTAGDIDVTVTPRVNCDDCATTQTITEFLREGGCNCPAGTGTETTGDGDSTTDE